MSMTTLRTLLAVSLMLSAGCDREREDIRDCSAADVSLAEALPSRLSETGLYSDIAAGVLAEGLIEVSPQFPLWTDSAKKRRWLLLPEGEQVDTQDADDWTFPVDTRTFKEFVRDDVRVETRMNLKTPDGWAAASYIWDDSGADATLQLTTAEDVSGTPHDVPGAAECGACHGGRGDFTLGFSATQLDEETRAALFEQGVLSDAVESVLDLDATTRAGLGYLHGNCSHCHNPTRDQQLQSTDCYAPGSHNDFDLTLPHGLQDTADAPAVRTARKQLGSPGDSKVLNRMSTREWDDDRPPMPPLGTELVDEEGVEAVRAFIEAL